VVVEIFELLRLAFLEGQAAEDVGILLVEAADRILSSSSPPPSDFATIDRILISVLRSISSGRITGDATLDYASSSGGVRSSARRLKLSSELDVPMAAAGGVVKFPPAGGYSSATSAIIESNVAVDVVSYLLSSTHSAPQDTLFVSGLLAMRAFGIDGAEVDMRTSQSRIVYTIPSSVAGTSLGGSLSNRRCVMWNSTAGAWASGGCVVVAVNASTTTCACSGGGIIAALNTQAASLCGNGIRDEGEECDDANTSVGDGCTGCRVDDGWTCLPKTGGETCSPICGNGRRFGGKECDDGNVANGDGCTAACTIERGWSCSGGTLTSKDTCIVRCGDGIRFGSEGCDDGNGISGDGCSSTCAIEQGFVCNHTARSTDFFADSFCTRCGDLRRLGNFNNEQCDSNSPGCVNCIVQPFWACEQVGLTDICTPVCGDGRVLAAGECDDGNRVDNDGCSRSCTFEPGFKCSNGTATSRTVCQSICGDGRRVGAEQCDDENRISVCVHHFFVLT
jgi:cysteine-rich repeat protein